MTFPAPPPSSTPQLHIHIHNTEPCPGAAHVGITWHLESIFEDSVLPNSLSCVGSELRPPPSQNYTTPSKAGLSAMADGNAYPIFHMGPYISQPLLSLHWYHGTNSSQRAMRGSDVCCFQWEVVKSRSEFLFLC